MDATAAADKGATGSRLGDPPSPRNGVPCKGVCSASSGHRRSRGLMALSVAGVWPRVHGSRMRTTHLLERLQRASRRQPRALGLLHRAAGCDVLCSMVARRAMTLQRTAYRRKAVEARKSHTLPPMNAVLTATVQRVRMDMSVATAPMLGSRNGTLYRPFRTAFERTVR
jgi:hypothetical protein